MLSLGNWSLRYVFTARSTEKLRVEENAKSSVKVILGEQE